MPSKVLRLAAYLLLWPLSTPLVNPQWPSPCGAQPALLPSRISLAASLNLGLAPSYASVTCTDQADPLHSRIRRTPICIVWTKTWAGDLGKTLLFQTKRVGSDRIVVGYFAYWTTERAWGDNGLTRWFFPAVAIDSFYSHLFFVLPGVQRFLYGPGDVEGVRITYQLGKAEKLVPLSLVADDASHKEVTLDINQAIDDSGRIVVYDDVWSHQLGGRGAAATALAGASQQCFGGDSLRSITPDIVREFRLGSVKNPRRAGPAWGND